MKLSGIFLSLALGATVLWPASAQAQEETQGFARVIVSSTELRSGPGVSHRVVHRAERGDILFIEERDQVGFWLRVTLADGRTAYILGDTVETIAVDPAAEDAPSKPGVFAPPAMQEAYGGFSMLGGIFDGDGYMEVRPQLVIGPAIAFEPYVGVALERDGRRLVYGGSATLNLAPDWAVGPFVTLGVGGVRSDPRDEFVRSSTKSFHSRAGGGFLISLRWRVLLRLEADNVVLFTEDSYENVQSYTAGVGTYF